MSHRVRVCVITCDAPDNVEQLTASLSNCREATFSLLVVDDSTTAAARRENRALVEDAGYDALYVDADAFQRYVRALRASDVDADALDLLADVELGRDEWNTPNARRVTHLLCHAVLSDDHYLFLDDDMRATRSVDFDALPLDRPLVGMRLTGSLDLTRMEWILLCNRLAALEHPRTFPLDPTSDAAEVYGNDYLERVVETLDPAEIRASLGRYTTLLPGTAGETRPSSIPSRDEINGGAFLCTDRSVGHGYYPPWYGEDWSWFEFICERFGVDKHVSDATFVHDAREKNVVDRDALRREAYGMFVTKLTQEYVRHGALDVARIDALRDRRIDRLRRERELAEATASAVGVDADLPAAMRAAIDRLDAIDPDAIAARVAEFHDYHADWRDAVTAAAAADVSTERLRAST